MCVCAHVSTGGHLSMGVCAWVCVNMCVCEHVCVWVGAHTLC